MSVKPSETSGSALRVGYVLKKYPRLSETFVLQEILGLEAAGAEVSIFSLRPPDEGRFHRDLARVRAGVSYLPAFGSTSTLDALGLLAEIDAPGPALNDALRFLDLLPAERRAGLLVAGLQVGRRARSAGLDHLHAHFMTVAAYTAYLAHLFTGIPFTVTAHAKDIYRDSVDARPFEVVAGAARALVTVCEANRRWIAERFLGGDGSRVVRIYNGLPLDEISGHAQPADGASRDRSLILGVGRLVEKKGFDVLLRACRILLDGGHAVRCVIVGDGEEAAALHDLRDRLGLAGSVKLVGAAPREDALAWMARARVLAAPCRTGADGNRDALPTVLLEALALGLPVVTTPVAGVPEIIDPGIEGELIAPDDPAALADALERVLGDDLLWRRQSSAGPAKAAARFDRRRTLPQLIELFRRAQPDLLEVPA